MLVCVAVLCGTITTAAVAVASAPMHSAMFPEADMGLKLAMDLAATASDQHGEQCFSFFPNTPFQGQPLLYLACLT